MADSHANPGSTKKLPQRACCHYPVSVYLSKSPLAPHVSRSHARPALKSKSFDDRMEKATKAQAIKKLQAELKEEKQAEIQR